MRILMYSDLHISRTSSILPLYSSNSHYTYRQNMILKTGEWLAQLMVNEKPDLIINLGDTFDQHTITSYDVHIASKFFKCFNDRMSLNNLQIPHYVIVGNHEMINSEFNAVALLSNIPGIIVIDEAQTINNMAFLPYCDYKNIIDFPKGEFLFSHQDIQGSSIRGNFVLPSGINKDALKQYKLVFNGHIHKSSILNNVVNVGSVTTHSFSDDDTTIPQAYVFNTETLDLKSFINFNCPLFRKAEVQSEAELDNYLDALNINFKYILHINCPYEIKDAIKNKLIDSDKVLNSKLSVSVKKEQKIAESEITNLQGNIDVKQSFKDFLNSADLKFPLDLYDEVLNGID